MDTASLCFHCYAVHQQQNIELDQTLLYEIIVEESKLSPLLSLPQSLVPASTNKKIHLRHPSEFFDRRLMP
jgi:hypothetical protein